MPRSSNEQGSVLVALLLALLVGAVAASLVAVTTTETLISGSYRHAQEASFGAEAALERALHDLASIPDWSRVLAPPPGNITSSLDDGETVPRGPDGRLLDLAQLTASRQRDSDINDGPAVFGADSPQWRLFAHAKPTDLAPSPGLDIPLYFIVWVADDESDGDGEATVDSNGRVQLYATAFGAGGTRRSVTARVARTAFAELRIDAWGRPH